MWLVIMVSGELGSQAKSARGEVGPLEKSARAKSAQEGSHLSPGVFYSFFAEIFKFNARAYPLY